MEKIEFLPQYVEFMALVYHEGRSTSRLFRLNAASRHTFGRLAELPPTSGQAWEKLIPAQREALTVASASAAEGVFHHHFGCSLEDLAAVFENPAWKRIPLYGGAPWAAIAKSVIALRDAIDHDDEAAAKKLLDEIPAMRHGSGTVRHKLAQVKAPPR